MASRSGMRIGTIVIVVATASLLAACDANSGCRAKTLSTVPAPDGRYVAEIAEVTCATRTANHFRVKLHDNQAVFLRSERITSVERANSISVRWLGERQLVVNLNGGRRVAAFADWHGVLIAYEGKAAGDP